MSLIKLYFLLYIIPGLSHITFSIFVIFLCLIVISFTCFIVLNTSTPENKDDVDQLRIIKRCSSAAFKFSILFFILSMLTFLCPSKKDIMTIYSIHYVSTNQDISQIPDNAAKFLNQQLQKELTGDKK